jgi:hypothetical protein
MEKKRLPPVRPLISVIEFERFSPLPAVILSREALAARQGRVNCAMIVPCAPDF